MKKKICIAILIICLLGVIVFGMYVIDRIRMKNNKPVIFSNWGYSYVPPIDLPEEEIYNEIMSFIVDRGDNEKHHENAKTFASMEVYLIEEKESFTKFNIYAWVLEEKYYLENNEIKQDGGSSIPYKFVVENIEGKFTVTDSIIPRDGSYYVDDMKSIFPSNVRRDMERIHTDGTMDELNADIQKKVELYFHKKIDEKEAQIIETINTTFATYHKMSDGTWQCNGNSYKYKLEVTDRMPNAVMDSTYVYLSNIEDIPFERAHKAAGFSSSTADYFSVEDAIFIDCFSGE